MELIEVVRDIFELAKQNNPNYTENWDILAAFAEMDLNKDGEISEEEFITACLKQKKCSTIVILHIFDFPNSKKFCLWFNEHERLNVSIQH
jgi:hypothetical protein